ncbi:MAG TPA: fructosamine kinase family protein [Micromonosporaceae bacterium]|nr:fructosamine kinase family protein [Micromonosporaceae bacterium]
MDLGYLRAHPDQLAVFLKHQRIRTTPVPGGSICDAERLTLDDGSDLFAKSLSDPPEGFFASEAAGLHWLHQGCPNLACEVIAATDQMLVLPWLEPGEPTRAAAVLFGGHLARLHASGAESFGAPWHGYIGRLRLDNTPTAGLWPDWFAERRLLPYLKRSVDNGALDRTDAALVESVIRRIDRLVGPPEQPSRLHGDLWPGNILWGVDHAWLVDPAAHGGHRETDLATLRLFGGAPYLEEIVAGYQEQFPLPDGWRDRVPLHQLHLLLVHTALFGGGYRSAVLAAARRL